MFNFTESPAEFLQSRRSFLNILIEGLREARNIETDPTKHQNLHNGLVVMKNELIDIELELTVRGLLLP